MPGRFAAGHFFFRHRASGGRGPPCAARWGRALLTRRFTFVDGSSTRPAPPPHPSFAALTTGGPPPPRSRGRKAKPPVLAARFFCTRVMRHAISKNDAGNPTFVRCPRQWKSPDASRSETAKAVARMSEAKSGDDLAAFTAAPRVSLRSTRATKSFQTRFLQQKGSRTPTDAGSLLHLPAKRAPWPGRARLSAFHCGSRQGDSWSPRLSVRPCFPGPSGAFDPVRPLQPGSGDLALRHA